MTQLLITGGKTQVIGQSAQRILGQLLEKWISRESERLSFTKIGNKGPRSSTVQGHKNERGKVPWKNKCNTSYSIEECYQ